jgi:hypothetical protein
MCIFRDAVRTACVCDVEQLLLLSPLAASSQISLIATPLCRLYPGKGRRFITRTGQTVILASRCVLILYVALGLLLCIAINPSANRKALI